MPFRGIFFAVTELSPPDPLMGKTSSFFLLCYMLLRMEAVGKKTRTFLKRSILEVYTSTHGCLCAVACMCMCVCISVCTIIRQRMCLLTFWTLHPSWCPLIVYTYICACCYTCMWFIICLGSFVFFQKTEYARYTHTVFLMCVMIHSSPLMVNTVEF